MLIKYDVFLMCNLFAKYSILRDLIRIESLAKFLDRNLKIDQLKLELILFTLIS